MFVRFDPGGDHLAGCASSGVRDALSGFVRRILHFQPGRL